MILGRCSDPLFLCGEENLNIEDAHITGMAFVLE